MQSPALIAFKEDIEQRSWNDWLKAHTSMMKPLYRYEGTVQIDPSALGFTGMDVTTNEQFELRIPKHAVEQLYHGLDDVYSAGETRSMGLFWKPIRIQYHSAGEHTLYLIANYHMGITDNAQWYEALKEWLA